MVQTQFIKIKSCLCGVPFTWCSLGTSRQRVVLAVCLSHGADSVHQDQELSLRCAFTWCSLGTSRQRSCLRRFVFHMVQTQFIKIKSCLCGVPFTWCSPRYLKAKSCLSGLSFTWCRLSSSRSRVVFAVVPFTWCSLGTLKAKRLSLAVCLSHGADSVHQDQELSLRCAFHRV
ncbi:hypothetical protein BaRGS_00026717 [Batillaria attramentaria]|uniref:Uncharacterized protein n=1 Tax=Batillaria attramentaria TaxID=370345 RepID=A0ABD0K533_9CAEN